MKRRVLSMLLCAAMVASLVIGCGSKSDDADTTSTAEAETEEQEESDVQADPVDQRRVYVTPEWVKSVIDGNQEGYENYVILEASWGEASDEYKAEHVPGAAHVDTCEVEDGTGSDEGKYNLLSPEEVEANLLARGITKDTKVILYGDSAGGVGRVAYGYLWAGVEDVKILNGGLEAWKAAGYDVESGEVKAEATTEEFGTTVPAHPEYWVSIDEAKEKLESDDNFKLVSIRSEDEWLGINSGYSYMDKAGEPEGAVWGKGCETAYDMNDFTNEDGTIKELEGLEEVWADCDFTLDNHLSFYCGTGWRATVPFLVLYQEGYDNISVFDGGWYEWLMDDSNPVQVGDPASADCVHTTVGELETGKALN